jgi:hypothetical protein
MDGLVYNGWSIPRTLRELHLRGSCTYGPKGRGSISSYHFYLRRKTTHFQKYSAFLFRKIRTIEFKEMSLKNALPVIKTLNS